MDDDLAEVIRVLTEVVGEEYLAGMEIGPETAFTGALALESIEFAEFAARLRARHGDRADLPGLVADLDSDGLLALTVGDVADLVADARTPSGADR